MRAGRRSTKRILGNHIKSINITLIEITH